MNQNNGTALEAKILGKAAPMNNIADQNSNKKGDKKKS